MFPPFHTNQPIIDIANHRPTFLLNLKGLEMPNCIAMVTMTRARSAEARIPHGVFPDPVDRIGRIDVLANNAGEKETTNEYRFDHRRQPGYGLADGM